MDTLVFDYGLVAINRPGDLHPLDLCHARHTEASSGSRQRLPFVVLEGNSFLRYGLHSDQCRSERTHFRM